MLAIAKIFYELSTPTLTSTAAFGVILHARLNDQSQHTQINETIRNEENGR